MVGEREKGATWPILRLPYLSSACFTWTLAALFSQASTLAFLDASWYIIAVNFYFDLLFSAGLRKEAQSARSSPPSPPSSSSSSSSSTSPTPTTTRTRRTRTTKTTTTMCKHMTTSLSAWTRTWALKPWWWCWAGKNNNDQNNKLYVQKLFRQLKSGLISWRPLIGKMLKQLVVGEEEQLHGILLTELAHVLLEPTWPDLTCSLVVVGN